MGVELLDLIILRLHKSYPYDPYIIEIKYVTVIYFLRNQ